MIVSYTPGRVRLRMPQLKNPFIASAVKKRLADVKGIEDVEIKLITGSMLIIFDPEILPPESLFKKGQEELRKYNIILDMPTI